MIGPGETTGTINKEGNKVGEMTEMIEKIKDMGIEIRIIEILEVIKSGSNFRSGIGNAISAKMSISQEEANVIFVRKRRATYQ